MAANKITVEAGTTKTIFLSLEDSSPLINVAVTTGSVKVTLSSSGVADANAKKGTLPLKAGESAIVSAATVRVSNATATDAKVEFSVIGK